MTSDREQIKVTSGGQSPPITISIEDWCRLCDVLRIPPDTNIEDVIVKVNTWREQLQVQQKLGELT
jgi:hypothetical protein